MARQPIGLVGLGVMGRNLLLNLADHGYPVAGFDLDAAKVEALRSRAAGRSIQTAGSLEELVRRLQPPRAILMLVPAGSPVDQVIQGLAPFLGRGDVLIDGGNSHFTDTERRIADLAKQGILYMGIGVSGGEEGARKGPSIMPGGSKEAYALVGEIFERCAAQADGPCCAYIGPRGAGHYIKMVHNGIEYGIMQCIADVYDIMKTVLGMEPKEMSDVLAEWNAGELGGYLMEITVVNLAAVDPDTGKPLVDVILDQAGQKGTGKWTSQNALDLGIACPTIDMAVEGRILSAFKSERIAASKVLKGPAGKSSAHKGAVLQALRDAMYVAEIGCYAQGFALMGAASREYQYSLNLSEIARIWKGGCIIRSKLLGPITAAYRNSPDLANLLVDDFFAKIVNAKTSSLRTVVCEAAKAGVPVLGLASVLGYVDSYRRQRLPQNLTQAQRDYFGAHTYQRVDKEGTFHTPWVEY